MKVLLDHNVPRQLAKHLRGHLAMPAGALGWAGHHNGDLLAAGERNGYEVLITGDKNMSYQQNLSGRMLSLIVLSTTYWPLLKPLIPSIIAALGRVEPGSFEQL